MFCTEDRPRLTSKMREIQIRPVPIANVSCHNEEVWDTRILAWQNVMQSSVLAILAMATLIANLIFVLVLRSNKYHRSVHVQVRFHLSIVIHGANLLIMSFSISFAVTLFPNCVSLQLHFERFMYSNVCCVFWSNGLLALWRNRLPGSG